MRLIVVGLTPERAASSRWRCGTLEDFGEAKASGH